MKPDRKLLLAVAVLAIAVLASTPLLGAAWGGSHLWALEDAAIIGTSTPLYVQVDPGFVGGTGHLFAVASDGDVECLGAFPMHAPAFVQFAPVPPSLGEPGETTTYFFLACGANGKTSWSNGAAILLKGGQGTDEPPIWD
jgi:hypothetical protein